MEVTKNVQKRRQEKIRSILEKQETEAPEIWVPGGQANHSASNLERQEADPRWEDPEYVWNENYENKWRQLGSDNFHDDAVKPPGRKTRGIAKRFLASILLFALVWAAFHTDKPWTRPVKAFVTSAMTKDYNFKTAEVWYHHYFSGSPSFIPIFHLSGTESKKVNANPFYAPVKGTVTQGFSVQREGITVEANEGASIVSVGTGRVSFVGQTADHGLVVRIQHANGWTSVYGDLQNTDVKVDDWVKGGEKIGLGKAGKTPGKSLLYFELQHNGQYINPVDVVSFD